MSDYTTSNASTEASSCALNLSAAAEADVDPDEVRGVLAAIAPIVGTARVASANAKIAEVLAVAIEAAELEAEAEAAT